MPAVIAVFLYSQLPIISNTYAAFRSIDPAQREAAHGMGMTRMQRLWLVEAPMVLPVIIAGVRTAIVLNIGIAAIAAYIGAGGLGLLIRSGITQTDTRQILAGAIAVSLLALALGSPVRPPAAAAHFARPRPRMIQIEKLSKEFVQDGRRVVALDGIDLEVPHGEICVLLGPSGCGKTTTLKIINRLVTPSGGRVLVDGQDTGEFDAIELRRKIGYVIQQVGLFRAHDGRGEHRHRAAPSGLARRKAAPARARAPRHGRARSRTVTPGATRASCRAARRSASASPAPSPPIRRSC